MIGAALSSASKPPSFYAIGHPFVGNPGLSPECSRLVELGHASEETTRWKTRFTLFHARYQDLIDFDAGPTPRLANWEAIRTSGLEFNARWQWRARLQAFGQGTLLHLRDPNGGPPLRYRPRVHTSIGMQADVGQHSRLHGSVTYVGRRFVSSVPAGDVWVGGFALLDLIYTWLGRGWEGYVAIDNAFNRQAYEVVGTATRERRLRAGLPWNL